MLRINMVLYYIIMSFFTLFVSLTNLFGQKQNSYKFIEPNISISYDSNCFKITKRYSNTLYGTEAYDYSYQCDTTKKVVIHVKADHPTQYPPKKFSDSLILAELYEVKKTENDSFSVVNVDTKINEINGFSLVGFVGFDKINKRYGVVIRGFHFSDKDNTEILLMANGNDLEDGYKILAILLKGFNSYSRSQIDEEALLIKKKYTIIVTPTNQITENVKNTPKTYVGYVSIQQKLEHIISEVRLSGLLGSQQFMPNETGQVLIVSLDKERGQVVKKGDVIILNSFGKEVKLPFSFTYFNNGEW